MTFIKSLYLRRRLFVALGGVAVLYVLGYFAPVLAAAADVAAVGVVLLLLLDVVLLFRTAGVAARRVAPDRLSNGDANALAVYVENGYPFELHAEVLEELPVQLQARDARFRLRLGPGASQAVRYTVRPVTRGAYAFGAVNVYAGTRLGLASRRYRFDDGRVVPVYPSFLQMRRYELLAISNRLDEVGVKKVRRVGHTMEFDHVREYVVGDDVRAVNWKASARRGALMVNQHRDERAQPVYCLVDTGRVMKMPFEGMTLLDHSVNASLVLANIALLKQDRAGLVTFAHEIGATVPAERRGGQLRAIMEGLYDVRTDFLESDYERLYGHLRRVLRRRSLLLLFTNFETRSSMQRRLPQLRALARQHVLVVVFFENTELRALLDAPPADTEQIYVKAVAEQFAVEKREIVAELNRHGIHAVLTPPEELSAAAINKYLELKARGMA